PTSEPSSAIAAALREAAQREATRQEAWQAARQVEAQPAEAQPVEVQQEAAPPRAAPSSQRRAFRWAAAARSGPTRGWCWRSPCCDAGSRSVRVGEVAGH